MGSNSIAVNAVSPGLSIWSSQNLGAELASLALKALDPTGNSVILNDGWVTGTAESSFDPALYSPEPFTKSDSCHNHSPKHRTSTSDDTSDQHGPQDRVRLASSGGLAGRRPPTRVVVEPPLVLPPGVELNTIYSVYSSPSVRQNGDQEDSERSTSVSPKSSSTKPTNSSPFLPELLVRSGSSEPHVATPTPPADPPSPTRDHHANLMESDQVIVEAQPLLTLASPAGSPTPSMSAKHKRFGVELPGLSSANQVVLRHRERPGSTPPATFDLSAAEVRRQANTALLSSLKGLSQSP
ncbi:unnamed protein product [Echinostoma caproni]|uniref:Uncharacterized protein n=1 Tax=Echinostoma caproni TaxID=27848 RepID=A0A183ABW6_9TREM|nr:unnamed protein product [Echinostoma caproni]